MASPIDAVVLLCDAAQADPFGRMHMLGAWLVCDVHADSASCGLIDADDAPVSVPGMTVIRVEQTIEVGRPPGMAPGSMIDAAFQISVPPLPLPPGRYQWRLDVGDQQFPSPSRYEDSRDV